MLTGRHSIQNCKENLKFEMVYEKENMLNRFSKNLGQIKKCNYLRSIRFVIRIHANKCV
jgi:hypothetical protein